MAGAGVPGGAVTARRRHAAASCRRGGEPTDVLPPPSPARSEGRAATAAARRRRRCWRPWRVGWRPRGPCGSASRWAPSRSSQAALVAAAANRPPYSEKGGIFWCVGHSRMCMGTVFFLFSVVRGMCLMVSVAFSVHRTTLGACYPLTCLPIGFVLVAGFHPSRDFARASRINQTYKRSGNATELLTLLANKRSAAPAQSIGQRFRPPRSLVSVCAQDDVDAMRPCLDSLLKRSGADLAASAKAHEASRTRA